MKLSRAVSLQKNLVLLENFTFLMWCVKPDYNPEIQLKSICWPFSKHPDQAKHFIPNANWVHSDAQNLWDELNFLDPNNILHCKIEKILSLQILVE